jgi:hypothetical protein
MKYTPIPVKHPIVGTTWCIQVKFEGRDPAILCHFGEPYTFDTNEEARQYIKEELSF